MEPTHNLAPLGFGRFAQVHLQVSQRAHHYSQHCRWISQHWYVLIKLPQKIASDLHPDTVAIYANVVAHFANVSDVRFGDSFENQFLNRTGMWRFYRFQSAETDENAVLSIQFTPSSGHSDLFYFIGGFPTTEQVCSYTYVDANVPLKNESNSPHPELALVELQNR